MTISTTAIRVDYVGNGLTTAFAVPFAVFAPTHIEVIERVVATGAETVLTYGTHYGVSLNPDQNTAPGGSVTATTAPAAGTQWTIRRVTSQTQDTDYVENDNFPANTAERTVDLPVAMVQELGEELGRTLRFPRTDGAVDEMPSLGERASRVAGFGPAGEFALYTPPTISGLSEVLPDGALNGVSADLLIRRLIDVDIYSFGAHPDASAAQNDTAIAAAVARANAVGGILKADLVPGDYQTFANIPALTTARGIDVAASTFISTDPAQTGPYLSFGRLVTGGIQHPVIRIGALTRQTVSDWTDETQIGLLLRCVQNAKGAHAITVGEIDGFTYAGRLQGEYDGTTAADAVHNEIRIGRTIRCRHGFNLYSNSPGLGGAPNHNDIRIVNLTAHTDINTSLDRYGFSLTRRTWFSGTFTADATANTLTLGSGGTIPTNGRVTLSTTGTLPAGLVAGNYYVVSSAGSVIQLGTTLGGAAVDFSDAGTGTHSLTCQGYGSHNNNVFEAAFQHARSGTGTAYCILDEVQSTQNRLLPGSRAEWIAPAVMKSSLTRGNGGGNIGDIDFATSNLRDELADVSDTGVTKAAWFIRNHRYRAIAMAATRVIFSAPDLRAILYADDRPGATSYGFDTLHVTYTSMPTGGPGVATIATVCLRSDQRAALGPTEGIVPGADAITIGASRGIGVMVDTRECKVLVPMHAQKGTRGGRYAFRFFDADGALLDSTAVLLVDHPSASVTYNTTGLYWQVSSEQTDADQLNHLGFRVPEVAKYTQVALIYAGTSVADVQSFTVATPEPYAPRCFHGVDGGTRELIGSVAWDPPNLVTGTSGSKTMTLLGAAKGDHVGVHFSESTGNMGFSGSMQGSDTPVATLSNGTGGDSNAASGILTFTITKRRIAGAVSPAPPPVADMLLLEDGVSHLLLEDGSGRLLLE